MRDRAVTDDAWAGSPAPVPALERAVYRQLEGQPAPVVAAERGAAYVSSLPAPSGELAEAIGDVRAAAARLAAVDVSGAADDEVAEALGGLVEVEAGLAEIQARVVRSFDTREAFRRDACVSTGGWLRLHTPLGHAAIKRLTSRARVLGRMPLLSAALAGGQVSAGHVDVIARRATPARLDDLAVHEETLTRLACDAEPQDVAVAVKRIVEHRDPDGSQDPPLCESQDLREFGVTNGFAGLSNLRGTATPLLTELLIRARDLYSTPDPPDTPPAQRRTPGQRWHDALVAALTAAIDAHPNAAVDGVKAHVVVLCDLLTLLGADDAARIAPRLLSGQPLDGPTLRHLLADANPTLRAVLALGPWQPVAVGRTRRGLPDYLRGTLALVHRHCRAPGCDRPPAWCEADHNLEWHQGGHTSLDNTTPECVAHNWLKHTDGWKVRSGPTTGTVTWTSADGTRVITLPPPEP